MNLSPGRYQCEVTAPNNGWIAESEKKGTPYIRIPLVVTEGRSEGVEVVYQAWISQTAASRTLKNLEEVFPGWKRENLTELAQQVDTGFFVGLPCSIVVENEQSEVNGKMYAKIKWLNGPTQPDKMLDVNKALQLARRLSGEPDPAWDEQPAAPPAKKPPIDPLDAEETSPF